MLLLGIVKSIGDAHLDVALPGKLSGKVPINSISGPYTKLLEKVVNDEAENNVSVLFVKVKKKY